MGLDAVEIVMMAEERFGIEIADREAENIRTPGMFIDLIFGKVKQATAARCQTQRSFYLVRRALSSICGVERGSIRPETRIRGFVAVHGERAFWARLRIEVGARWWPALAFPAGVETAGKIGFLLLCVSGIVIGWQVGLFSSGGGTVVAILFLGVLAPALLVAALARLLSPLRTFIPARIACVGDLVPYAATSDGMDWSREDVARGVREIVEDVLAPGPEYREDADFVKELGLS